MKTKLSGRVWKWDRDVDTDVIIAARYLTTTEPSELAEHCMESADPDFAKNVREGDIFVAGHNFGCGSSREHAPISIQASGVAAVVAPSYARIFFRNAINLALPVVICPDEVVEKVSQFDDIELDLDAGTITIPKTGETFSATPLPPFMQGLFNKGGLVPYTIERLKEQGRL